MSSLTAVQKRYLEKILHMRNGYVLDFTNATFDEFFRRYKVDIHGHQYQIFGTSKANKLRAFWERESDALVGRVLSEMLDNYEVDCDLNGRVRNTALLAKNREIVAKLSGKAPVVKPLPIEGFLSKEIEMPNVQRLPVESNVAKIIESRLNEALAVQSARAHLSVIILCGSVLEGVLLGAAIQQPAKFNRSPTSPKRSDGKVKQFREWSLADFINVAHDVGLLKADVKEFSHGLREFRNYIHPYEQVGSRFTPDGYTANVCLQVLKAALADVAGER